MAKKKKQLPEGYDSWFELECEQQTGLTKNTTVKINYQTEHTYTPDYIKDGIYYESKGYLRPSDRSKMVAVKKSNPDIRICFIFQNPNNKLSKKPKSLTYSQWAERNGFQWITNGNNGGRSNGI